MRNCGLKHALPHQNPDKITAIPRLFAATGGNSGAKFVSLIS
jgi:hypothetical protein